MTVVVVGIITSLVAAIIYAFVKFLYLKGFIHQSYDWILFIVAPSGLKNKNLLPTETTKLQKKIIRKLLIDQSRFGYHRGQFGKSCDSLNSEKWQPKGSREKMNLKPRIYMTYWPLFIFKKHNIEHHSVKLAIAGIRELFQNNRISLFTSAPETSPTSHSQKWSIRHTMAGAHILAFQDPNNSITRSVIGQMLDKENLWQESLGGWKQTSEPNNKPDLWASVYAVKLLDFAITENLKPFSEKTDILKESIKKTFSYLEKEFVDSSWGVTGKLLIEENLITIFTDLAHLLPDYSPFLFEKCISEMKKWLDSAGYLRVTYLSTLEKQLTPVSEEQAYLRMAYAFYLAKDETVDWRPWFEKVSKSSLKSLFSYELAFLLDLTYGYKT